MTTIHELLEYGPIVAHDEDYDLLITVNGAYFNLWAGRGGGTYENTEAYHLGSRAPRPDHLEGLYGTLTVDVINTAEQLLEDLTNADTDEDR